MGFGLLLPEYEDLGPELQCLLKVKEDLLSYVLIFQDAKNDVLNWLKSKLFHFSVDHNDIFDHKYCIDPGNLFSMLKYQYLN